MVDQYLLSLSLVQATMCDLDQRNIGTSDLMYADCVMITPTKTHATTQSNEMSLVYAALTWVIHVRCYIGR